LIMGIVVIGLEKIGFEFRLRSLIFILIITYITISIISSSSLLLDRWGMFIYDFESSSREKIVIHSIDMVREKPLLGWGPMAKTELAWRTFPFRGLVLATHNMPLAMLTYNGILGAIPYFYAYFLVSLAAYRAHLGREKILPLAIFTALFTSDMVNGGLPDKLHWVLFAYILAVAQEEIVSNQGQREKTG